MILNQLPDESDDDDLNSDEDNDNWTVFEAKEDKLPPYDLIRQLQEIMKEDDSDDAGDDDPWKLLSRKNPVFDDEKPSAKALALIPLVEEKLKKGEKVIVVSTFLKILDIMQTMLTDKGISVEKFTGKTSVSTRDLVAKEFNMHNTEAKVLLLSMNVGSAGLNLTGANNMFILDVHWNPQKERQVIDRIHRMGQPKPVSIVK